MPPPPSTLADSTAALTLDSNSSSSSSSALAPPSTSYRSPRVLANVAEVLSFTRETSLLCCYFMAPWCGTCKRADPLYDHAARAWSDAQIVFTRFDCEPEEKLCEDTFQLYWVPTWKFWREGKLVGTIEGDWTQFEPMLRKLAGPPTNSVDVDPKQAALMAEHQARFVELSEKLAEKKRKEEEEKGRSEEEGSGSDSGSEEEDARKVGR